MPDTDRPQRMSEIEELLALFEAARSPLGASEYVSSVDAPLPSRVERVTVAVGERNAFIQLVNAFPRIVEALHDAERDKHALTLAAHDMATLIAERTEADTLRAEVDALRRALTSVPRDKALANVLAERERQDNKWGGASHDDQEPPMAWVDYVTRYASWAGMMALSGGAEGMAKYRRRMVQVSALALAAVQSFDRLTRPDTEAK